MYIETIIMLNYLFDFIILFGVNVILKNNASIKHINLGAITGLLLIPFMFLKLPFVINISVKIIYGLMMVIIAFKYKNICYTLKNFIYMFMLSTIIAGFLYLISLEVNYHIILLVLVPLYLYIIVYTLKQEKRINKYLYNVSLNINQNKLNIKGFLDTGNSVKDYALKNKVIIVSSNIINDYLDNKAFYYLNINTINGSELLRCYKVGDVYINDKRIDKCVIGVTNHLNNSSYDALIPNYLEEDLC
ncbi:MAG: sigma-E processing peptidase SpoIIGA [Bacilli bacterium]|nr:sigma-E processing peptidase SpoIIGA [Bacilli bacterium]